MWYWVELPLQTLQILNSCYNLLSFHFFLVLNMCTNKWEGELGVTTRWRGREKGKIIRGVTYMLLLFNFSFQFPLSTIFFLLFMQARGRHKRIVWEYNKREKNERRRREVFNSLSCRLGFCHLRILEKSINQGGQLGTRGRNMPKVTTYILRYASFEDETF